MTAMVRKSYFMYRIILKDNNDLIHVSITLFSKKKVKALYGSWAKELFAVDVGDYEEFMKDFNSGTSPSHHAKVC